MASLDAGELVDWWIAYQLEPWGSLRDDFREAGSLSVQAGQWGSSPVWPYITTADDVLEELDKITAEREQKRG